MRQHSLHTYSHIVKLLWAYTWLDGSGAGEQAPAASLTSHTRRLIPYPLFQSIASRAQ